MALCGFLMVLTCFMVLLCDFECASWWFEVFF